MSEQTIEPQSFASAEVDLEARPPVARDVVRPLDEARAEFDFWEDLKASWPPWINEVVGFSLMTFGILSFISLYVASDALVALTWADMLTSLFGDGALFVAGGLFLFGALLWLPKLGIHLRFGAGRLLALELMFLSLLAILHLSNNDSELRALARAGQGGGLIGWGLSYPFYWIMGRQAALVFFGAVAGLSLVAAIGLRRHHISAGMSRFASRLQSISDDAARADADTRQSQTEDLYKRLAGEPGYRTRIMRIRPRPSAPAPEASANGESSRGETRLERVRAATVLNDENAEAATQAVEETTAAPAEPEVQAQPAQPPESAAAAPSPWSDSLPGLDCLTPVALTLPSDAEIEHKAQIIQNTLLEFDLETTVLDVHVGPTVTRFALLPHKEDGSERIRMSKIASYARDLSLALAAKHLRLETPVPGTNFMGIEVPNHEPSVVALRDVLESDAYQEAKSRRGALLVPLGRDVAGGVIAVDLAQLPHLLIAGATGSGKSVCMAALATALLLQYRPDELRLVMLDPKMVELSRFNGLPHLVGPVEVERERIVGVLRWCAAEMDRRYKLMEEQGARNIKMYNERQLELGAEGETMPYIAIFVDEIGDLMLHSPEETERALTRLAQLARAVGMHLIIATQRPSANVITGLIKANFPARIAFSVASGADSRVIIDRAGAEDLLGQGDMLFLNSNAAAPLRVQGCFVSEADTRAVVSHWRAENARIATSAPPAPWDDSLERQRFLADTDPMFAESLALIVKSGEASASLLQRRLGLGYPRAARIMDLLEELGLVGEEISGGRSRTVTIPPEADPLDVARERFRALSAPANSGD